MPCKIFLHPEKIRYRGGGNYTLWHPPTHSRALRYWSYQQEFKHLRPMMLRWRMGGNKVTIAFGYYYGRFV
jgi:hypothetical protein